VVVAVGMQHEKSRHVMQGDEHCLLFQIRVIWACVFVCQALCACALRVLVLVRHLILSSEAQIGWKVECEHLEVVDFVHQPVICRCSQKVVEPAVADEVASSQAYPPLVLGWRHCWYPDWRMQV